MASDGSQGRHPGGIAELRTRIRLRADEVCCALFAPVLIRTQSWMWLRHFTAPRRLWARREPWPRLSWNTPASLRTVPGIWRDEEAADRNFAARPVYMFLTLHPESLRLFRRHGWAWMLPSMPRRARFQYDSNHASDPSRQPPEPTPDIEPELLTEELRTRANELGLSQIGFAPFDPRYVFGRRAGDPPSPQLSEGSVIVCVLEQDWALTQTIPSAKCERGVMRTYARVTGMARELAEFLHERGFQAQVHGPTGMLITINYAVEAGIGQLGLNGQLLTPEAGSRCRIVLITTNTSLVHGSPVDYGIHAICDECQLCVKRCPPGAIPIKREDHRGILKVKIKPERCVPTMALAHGCAVCMKVCPVQRYGLRTVSEHFMQTGEIFGKGTDELEGYDWPPDGRHYGPGQKPRISKDFLTPSGFSIDLSRQEPPGTVRDHDEVYI